MADQAATQRMVPFAAAACAALVGYDIAGHSARDSIFLSLIGSRSLPPATFGAAVLTILVATVASRRMLLTDPARYLSRAMVLSAVACVAELALIPVLPRTIAAVVYLHFTAVNGLFMAGFWMVVFERLDPRAVRRSGTMIWGVGTAGGIAAGLTGVLIAATHHIEWMLALLAAINLIAAIGLRGLRAESRTQALVADRLPTAMMTPAAIRSPAWNIFKRSRYVRVLVGLIIFCGIAETMIDYVFMTRAGTGFIRGAPLLRFFSLYYTGAAIITLGPLLFLSDRMLDRYGPSVTGATLPGALLFSGVFALWIPGLVTSGIARTAEIVLRNSNFRGAFDRMFNAIRPAEKRPIKTLVEVTSLRIGRIIAAVVTQVVLLALPRPMLLPALTICMMLAAAVALLLFRGMDRASLEALQQNLVARSHRETRLPHERFATAMFPVAVSADGYSTGIFDPALDAVPDDPYARRRADLESTDAPRIIHALTTQLPDELVSAVIPLLGRDDVTRAALRALQYAPDTALPLLHAALFDTGFDLAVRRRIPFAIAAHHTAEARDSLLAGLADQRFEIRSRCGVALVHLVEAEPSLAPPRDMILGAALREVEVDRDVWEGRALIPLLPGEEAYTVLGDVLRERADQSLAHLFTLLSLIVPAAPLRAAYRSLQSTDPHLRGTALEYLEQVVPEEVRRGLWHVLEQPAHGPTHPTPEQAITDAVRARQSMEFRLDVLRGGARPDGSDATDATDEKPV